MTYIGVDLHKRQFTVCYRHAEDDQVIREFPNTPEGLNSFYDTIGCLDDVAVEAIGFSRNFVKKLVGKVNSVFLVHAAYNALISRSYKKTDAHDAKALAYGLEKGILPKARFRSEASYQLRSLLTARDVLVWHRVRLINLMHALLAANGIHTGRESLRTKRSWRTCDFSRLEFGEHLAWQIYCHQMEVVMADIRVLDKAIIEASQQMAGYSVLVSIPGFGEVTIAYLLSTIDGVEAFRSAKALCAYIGLVPRTRISDGKAVPSRNVGKSRIGSITRAGDTKTRTAITMSVNRLLAHNDSLRAFYDRVKARKGYRKARTAAARKLLTFVYYALKKGNPVSDFSVVDFSQPHIVP